MKQWNLIIRLSTFCACLIISVSSFAASVKEYETQQVLNATNVLPKSFFQSDLYKVDTQVINDGLMNNLYGYLKAWQF